MLHGNCGNIRFPSQYTTFAGRKEHCHLCRVFGNMVVGLDAGSGQPRPCHDGRQAAGKVVNYVIRRC